ncbi:MAG: EamA family transporter [Phycisphaerae bacterium]|nr:EamA family transporter [Phycisphaerae bacterium]
MQAIFFAVLAGLCWGVGEIHTKAAINSREIGPLGSVLVRAIVVLPLALLAWLIAVHLTRSEPQAWWREMSRANWLRLVLGSGVLAGFAGVFFFYLGLGSPGGDISTLRPIAFSLAPATAVVLGWLMLGEPLTVRKVVAVAFILGGIVLLTGEGGERAEPMSSRSAGAAAERGGPRA